MNRLNTGSITRGADETSFTKTSFNNKTNHKKDTAAETVYKRVRYKNTMSDSRALVFMTGFCLGMVFFYCTRNSGADSNPLAAMIAPSRLSQLKNFEAYKGGLLEYVTVSRFGQLLFLFLCATSAVGGVLAYGILGWCGFELGLLVFTAVYQHGIMGILLSLLLFLPHGICYSIVFFMVFHKAWGINKKDYHNEKTINSTSWHNKLTEFRKILVILTIHCLGILSETYINSEILRKIALFF